MTIDKRIVGVGIVCLFITAGLTGCVQQSGPNGGIITIPSVGATDVKDPKYAMAAYYASEEVTIQANTPQYTLPLTLSSMVNFASIDQVFALTDTQKDLLKQNGFVVRGYITDEDNIVEPYNYLKKNDVAIFITSDTLLHLYHIQFDQILKGIEEREFFETLLDLTKTLFDQSKQDYETFTDPILKEAARRNVGFFTVALLLMQTATQGYDGSEAIRSLQFSVPSYVDNNITQELSNIETHDGFHDSAIFMYKEDYSQYKPRGHYTQSEKLKRYFKAMMWYGRMSFLMKGGTPHCQECEFLLSEQDAKIQTIQASLIATALPVLTVNTQKLTTLWTRMYTVTSFFVGAADDLTPYEYLDCIQSVYGTTFNSTELTNDEKLLELKIKLAELRSPQIYGGTGQIVIFKQPGEPFTVEDLYKVLEKTKGMRLMGQRFIPDSYMFQQLVTPAVSVYTGSGTPFTMEMTQAGPMRCFPQGLDVMAVLGSERAYEILESEGDTAYYNYSEQLAKLQENFSSLNVSEWNRNLYFSWMYTLQALLHDYNDLYPTFMNTSAWQDKELQTVLASWAELRHDTILYAKQSTTPMTTSVNGGTNEKPVVGYVEPVPEFYMRILALTKMTRTGLTNLHVLNETETVRLENLEGILERLLNISKQELEGSELTEEDYTFIRNFGEQLDSIVTGVNDQGKETTMVADVHADTNTNQVLEEGVGYVEVIIVAYKVPDGRIIVGAGPVFSYYEFKQPLSNRLTDEQWKEQLQNGQEPDRPSWISSFVTE